MTVVLKNPKCSLFTLEEGSTRINLFKMSCSRQQPVPRPMPFPPSHLIATTQAFYQGLKLRWSASLRFDPGEKHDLPRLKAVWPAGSHH
jgi:hypothetical protein